MPVLNSSPASNISAASIIAIDSSSGSCSVAISIGCKIAAYKEELSGTLQAKRLLPMIEEALTESGTTYAETSKIAVTVGPGSFTGIRIALAAARGIGLAAGIPVIGFSGLEVLAFGAAQQQQNQHDKLPILAILNAGKGEVVYQHFNVELTATCPPTLGKLEEVRNMLLEPALIVGYGSENAITFPSADLLAQLAGAYPERFVAPLPFYIRPPDAKLPNCA